jgi:hypothetical protein
MPIPIIWARVAIVALGLVEVSMPTLAHPRANEVSAFGQPIQSKLAKIIRLRRTFALKGPKPGTIFSRPR